jgi:hypothetical protein
VDRRLGGPQSQSGLYVEEEILHYRESNPRLILICKRLEKKNMVVGPEGAETKNGCTGEGQQQFTRLNCTTLASQYGLCYSGLAQWHYMYVPPTLTFTSSEILFTCCIYEFLMIPRLLTDFPIENSLICLVMGTQCVF